ncbi:MAG: hypothetical protein P0Y53_16975 [Candidatus Pseudobacter hemicellulosilyticus]|uniref:CARDB domain-containing protein n=1 Tax=Candidatus Pseudobacter hemicellulosilyticus TaxID=3121375 RepID=A0AAJ5WR47_9BACT|nr:MAG: hypothetical protein P0Y53_16975 [Pseudobacter sp.]
MNRLLSWISFLLLAMACGQQPTGRNSFQMGRNKQLEKEGYTAVSQKSQYNKSFGYGWLNNPPPIVAMPVNNKLPLLLHSGATQDQPMQFRVDLPNGDYWMSLLAGAKDSVPTSISLQINEESLGDSLFFPWYRLPYRHIRRLVPVRDGKAVIQVSGKGFPLLHAVSFSPVKGWPKLPVSTGLETDTTTLLEWVQDMEVTASLSPDNASLWDKINSVQQYLQACRYYEMGGWLSASKATRLSLIYRLYITADILESIIVDTTHPLLDKSRYLLARTYYWLDKEMGVPAHRQRAQDLFAQLTPKYPDQPILRMYQGEKIIHPADIPNTVPHAPLWAQYQREAMGRMLELIHWWVQEKQLPNGELGGKYGDDVEMLRWWMPAILGAGDSLAALGYTKLADGVWNSGLLERGFAKDVDDVEHSAELFSDTHPAALLINYGDPRWVERCLISMQNFRDTWTAITASGHRHFKSAYLSASRVRAEAPYGVDVPLNARAARAGIWASWYNRDSSLLRLLEEWGRSWVQDAARTDNQKPAGILPAAVSFHKETLGGYGTHWYDPQLPYDYYSFSSIGHISELQYQLLALYAHTQDPFYLQPLDTVAAYLRRHTMSDQQAPAGSTEWVRQLLAGPGSSANGKLFSLAKQLTGSTQYDALIAQHGQPYNKFRLHGNRQELMAGLEQVLESLRYNWPLLTSEVKFTDRVYVPGSQLLTGMYTGHFGNGYEYPGLTATWQHTGKDMAILVQDGNTRSASISFFNFGAARTVQLQSWQLSPGLYSIQTGYDTNDDGQIDQPIAETRQTLAERVNRIPLHIPEGKTVVVNIRQLQQGAELPVSAPDLALSSLTLYKGGLFSGSYKVQCQLHNIGNIAATGIRIQLWIDGKMVEEQQPALLHAPRNLQPSQQAIQFKYSIAGEEKIQVKVSCVEKEITSFNNELKK